MTTQTPLGDQYPCARSTTLSLGGKWYERYGTAPCPVCQPERRRDQNALTLANGRGALLAHCKKSDCAFADILAAVGIAPGTFTAPDADVADRRDDEEVAQVKRRTRQAERCWNESLPVEGSIVETYLRGRGVKCDLPRTLRFHPDCWHGPTARRYPAMVALVEGAENFAVHRTYLLSDGSGKMPFGGGAKLMLGRTRGGAVRLSRSAGPLVVTEGIETALSLVSGLLQRPATVWAALSTSGIRGLCLPATPGRLTIATDGDEAGREAGQALAERANALGWVVSLLPAPDGCDWNDILIEKGAKQ